MPCQNNCNEFTCQTCDTERAYYPEGETGELLLHAKVYHLAQKYSVAELAGLARKKFTVACARFWGSDAFAIAAEHVYAAPGQDQALRMVIINMLMAHRDLAIKEDVKAFLLGRPSLMLQLFHAQQ